MWEVVKEKVDKARMAEAKGERTEEREDTKREEKRVQKTNSRRRNGDSENDRRKVRGRFDRDQDGRRNGFQKVP